MNHSPETAGRLDLKQIKGLCAKWPWMLATGILFIFLGTVATVMSTLTTVYSMLFFGILLLVASVVHFIKAFWTRDWRGFFLQVLLGVFSGVTGIFMVAKPLLSAASLTLLMASFFIVTGFFRIITSLAVNLEGWFWILVSGIISTTLGILILSSWPASALWVIGLFIGIELIFSGWYSVMLSFVIQQRACPLVPSTPEKS
jgi:uncharacterized membrane protein HdeD (DUF308 family)